MLYASSSFIDQSLPDFMEQSNFAIGGRSEDNSIGKPPFQREKGV